MGSLEEQIGAAVLTFGKLAVVGLAIVGAVSILQPTTLPDAGDGPALEPSTSTPAGVQAEAPAPTSTPTATPTPRPGTAGYDLSTVEAEFLRLLNQERERRSLRPLSQRDALTEMGRAHSRDMAERNYFAHESPDGVSAEERYRERGLLPECRIPIAGSDGYYPGAENIAQTYVGQEVQTTRGVVYIDSEAKLAENLFRQWMNSQGHREAMLVYSADEAGLGIYITPNGKVYASLELC
jgi:uncharacterized protein YkwD